MNAIRTPLLPTSANLNQIHSQHTAQPNPHHTLSLNSCIRHTRKSPRRHTKKSVRFTKEGTISLPASSPSSLLPLVPSVRVLMVAMDKAAEQEQRPSTPKNPKPTKPKTVGSSCTWRNDELQRFAVQLEYGVDPRRMIPDKFWEFDALSMYTKRNSLALQHHHKLVESCCRLFEWC